MMIRSQSEKLMPLNNFPIILTSTSLHVCSIAWCVVDFKSICTCQTQQTSYFNESAIDQNQKRVRPWNWGYWHRISRREVEPWPSPVFDDGPWIMGPHKNVLIIKVFYLIVVWAHLLHFSDGNKRQMCKWKCGCKKKDDRNKNKVVCVMLCPESDRL